MGARSWSIAVALVPALGCGLVDHDGGGRGDGASLDGASLGGAASGSSDDGSAASGSADDGGWLGQLDDELVLPECAAGVSGTPAYVVTTWGESAYGESTGVAAYTAEGWLLRSVSDYDSDGEV